MRTNNYQRKLRQLKYCLKLCRKFLTENLSNQDFILKIKARIKKLLAEVGFSIQKAEYKKLLTGLALAFSCLSVNSINAQYFSGPSINPFNLNGTEKFVDIDNDGDLDIIGQYSVAGHVETYYYYGYYGYYYYDLYVGGKHGLYYRFNDTQTGDVNFGPHTLFFESDQGGFFHVALADMDNDGDLDIIATNYSNYNSTLNFEYIKNNGTPSNPLFEYSIAAFLGLNNPSSVDRDSELHFADFDNDNDEDLFSISSANGNAILFKNLGTPSIPAFNTQTNNPYGMEVSNYSGFSFFIADFDADNDLDIFSLRENFMRYSENQGQLNTPSFLPINLSPFSLTLPDLVKGGAFGDIDNDGDEDFLSINAQGDLFVSKKSISLDSVSFEAPILNPYLLERIFFYAKPQLLDLDSDGDLDLLISNAERSVYFENNQIFSSLTEEQVNQIHVFPNPGSDLITISAKDPFYIEILDIYGKKVLVVDHVASEQKVNMSKLSPGSYIIKLISKDKTNMLNWVKK